MKKSLIVLTFIALAFLTLVSCSYTITGNQREEISEPIVLTSVTRADGTEVSYNSANIPYTDNEFFDGIITLSLPEGLEFSVNLSKDSTLNEHWYFFFDHRGASDANPTITLKEEVKAGDTSIELKIYKNPDDSYSGTYFFTFPDSVFNADYLGTITTFTFSVPKMI